jgi:hypothetical protein
MPLCVADAAAAVRTLNIHSSCDECRRNVRASRANAIFSQYWRSWCEATRSRVQCDTAEVCDALDAQGLCGRCALLHA